MALIDDNVASWNFNEASGNLLDQESTNDGVTSNITYGAAGILGDAYSFNGSSSEITVPSAAVLNFGATVKSFSFWMYPTAAGSSTIMNKGTSGNNPTQNIRFGSDRQIKTHFEGTGDQTPIMSSSGTVPLDEWTFIVVVYDLVNKTVDFYINGSHDVQRTYTTTVGAISPTQDFVLGSNDAGGDFFTGRLDEFNVFDAELSAANVTTLWNGGAGLTHPFATATVRLIKLVGTFVEKPILTKVAGTFVDKPIKIKVGGTFQDA